MELPAAGLYSNAPTRPGATCLQDDSQLSASHVAAGNKNQESQTALLPWGKCFPAGGFSGLAFFGIPCLPRMRSVLPDARQFNPPGPPQKDSLELFNMDILICDNVDAIFAKYRPGTFLPALCHIFMDINAPLEVLYANPNLPAV